jgi:endo-1,4-beta-xylanase
MAFKTARAADPNALLAYNDYGLEMDDAASEQKRAAVLVLLRRLKTRNVPIDAMGIQSHITVEALKAAPRRYAGLTGFISELNGMGLQVFLTELDVNDSNMSGDDLQRSHAVAQTYRNYLSAALSDKSVKAVLTWGISSRNTWLNRDKRFMRGDGHMQQPLPFDGDYRATPAFFAMRDAFDARGTAPVPAAVDAQQQADPFAPFTPHPGGEMPVKPTAAPAAPTPIVPASTLPPMPTTRK